MTQQRLRRVSASLLRFLFLCLACSAIAQPASVPRQDFWVTDGFVYSVVETNGVVYIGGDFKSITPNAGRGTLLNIFSGESVPLVPQINGAILAVAPDGAGGWFVGGEFTAMGGMPRTISPMCSPT